MRVLQDALYKKQFSIPEGKYYLADAGYANSGQLLTPYRGTRYHLKESINANLKPTTKEELFNLRHSSLRNVIERIFGVLKRRFKCLSSAPEYSIPTQVKIVYALVALHNFIRQQLPIELDIFEEEEEEVEVEAEVHSVISTIEGTEMDIFRDKIATQMWEDYQRYQINHLQV